MLFKTLKDEHAAAQKASSIGCLPTLQKINPVTCLYVSYKIHYYQGNPIVSDATFDALESRIREYDPENPCLSLVGAPSCSCSCRECIKLHLGS